MQTNIEPHERAFLRALTARSYLGKTARAYLDGIAGAKFVRWNVCP